MNGLKNSINNIEKKDMEILIKIKVVFNVKVLITGKEEKSLISWRISIYSLLDRTRKLRKVKPRNLIKTFIIYTPL